MFIADTLNHWGMSSEQEQGPSTVKWDRKHTNKYTKMLISEMDQFNGRN